MEYIQPSTQAREQFILCCDCGVQIEPNPANMCVACLRTHVDITEGIPKQASLYFCRNCERYLQPPSNWNQAALESRELLAICLKKLKGLSKVRLVDAGFIWTEPHSKRIKVKLSIQNEVLGGAVLQQVFVVEFVVHNQMCDDCHRVEAKDYWKACVQVRQKTHHKKTLYYLEQQILRHQAHTNTTSIKPVTNGIDFFYAQKSDAKKMVEFLQSVVPCRYGTSQELVSHDIHNNTYNYKTSYAVDIVPICKDNIVCLPAKLAQQLGNMGQVVICQRVTQTVHVIDPSSLQIAEVSGPVFWRSPFQALCNPHQLVEFTVMQVDIIRNDQKRHVAGSAPLSSKHVLADVWVEKTSELGEGHQLHCRTHLGHLLNPGDSALGFDLSNANVNDANLERVRPDRMPDVVLVKKVYADSASRRRHRKWKLKHLANAPETGSVGNDKDYTDFLEDLEEDPTWRANVNIYKDSTKLAVDTDDTISDEMPHVTLQEMMDDLHICEDATGGEGAPMLE